MQNFTVSSRDEFVVDRPIDRPIAHRLREAIICENLSPPPPLAAFSSFFGASATAVAFCAFMRSTAFISFPSAPDFRSANRDGPFFAGGGDDGGAGGFGASGFFGAAAGGVWYRAAKD
jgi:hypothetical protein